MFKDKKFARRLALVLCLSLVVGILPIGVLNAPVPVNAVPDDNMVVNGDFEASDTELLNWKQTSGKAAYVVTDKGVDGSNALNLVGKGQEVESDKFAVTSGAELTITFQYVQESDATKGLTAYALWYNEDGSWYDPNGIGDLNQYNDWCTSFGVTMSNEWQESVKVLTVPTGAAKVAIRFYAASSVGTESNIYIDDVTATEVAPTEPPKDAVFAENFDSNNSDAKLSAAGWTANENFSASNHNIGVYDTAYEGCALWMQQTSSAWAKTPAIAAVPGATYTVNVLTNGSEGAASMKLIFVDAAGNVLAESEEAIGTGAAWAEETVTAVAPENTANVYVYFDRGAKDCGIDNMEVYMTEGAAPEVTEPSTEATEPSTEATEPSEPAGDLVFSDKFEEHNLHEYTNSAGNPATNRIPEGWTSYDPANIRVACNRTILMFTKATTCSSRKPRATSGSRALRLMSQPAILILPTSWTSRCPALSAPALMPPSSLLTQTVLLSLPKPLLQVLPMNGLQTPLLLPLLQAQSLPTSSSV